MNEFVNLRFRTHDDFNNEPDIERAYLRIKVENRQEMEYKHASGISEEFLNVNQLHELTHEVAKNNGVREHWLYNDFTFSV